MKDKLQPIFLNGTYGVKNIYGKDPKKVVIIEAKGNRLIHKGIAEGTLLYVQIGAKYKEGDVIVVKDENGEYKVTTSVDTCLMTYYGRVFMIMNRFED